MHRSQVMVLFVKLKIHSISLVKSLFDVKHTKILNLSGLSAKSQSTALVLKRYPTEREPDKSTGLRPVLPVFVPSHQGLSVGAKE